MSARTLAFIAAALLPIAAAGVDAVSSNYRLVAPAPASTAAHASSPAYQLLVIGGSGEPVGISASTNASVVAGGTSAQLPTDRILAAGFE